MTPETDPRLAGLTVLLQLERDARHAESLAELGFLIVNETRKLVPYRQALMWELDDAGAAVIVAGSGASEFEIHAPYVVWTGELLRSQEVSALREVRSLLAAHVSEELQRNWSEFFPAHIMLVPLMSPSGALIGGLLFADENDWEEGHQFLLGRLADAYAHAWAALRGGQRKINWPALLNRRRKQIAVGLCVLALFPVRQSVIAPASVVPRNPVVVAAPIAGIVKEVYVLPSQPVKTGTPLFAFDNTDVDGRVEVARKSLGVARADLVKNMQLAYGCDECRAKIPVLQAEADQKEVELQYAISTQQRLVVRAEIDGTTVFRDKNDLLGKPVSVGERIMLLAQPGDSWLQVQLPVQDAITLSPGADVRFFLNIDPLAAYPAVLAQTSYEAEKTASDVLAYTIMADFSSAKPRLGLKGTARLYGGWAPLSYYLLRKPLAWVRQHIGW